MVRFCSRTMTSLSTKTTKLYSPLPRLKKSIWCATCSINTNSITNKWFKCRWRSNRTLWKQQATSSRCRVTMPINMNIRSHGTRTVIAATYQKPIRLSRSGDLAVVLNGFKIWARGKIENAMATREGNSSCPTIRSNKCVIESSSQR